MDPDTADPSLKLSDWISPDLVAIFPPEPTDKKRVIRTLVELIAEKQGYEDVDGLVAAVLERESGISTTLETGLSIPHARVKGHAGFSCALGVLPRGLHDPSGILIRVVLLFFSPASEEFFSAHLKFLRSVSTLFQAPVIERLSKVSDGGAAAAILQDLESAS